MNGFGEIPGKYEVWAESVLLRETGLKQVRKAEATSLNSSLAYLPCVTYMGKMKAYHQTPKYRAPDFIQISNVMSVFI